MHAANVLGAGFLADQNHLVALGRQRLGFGGGQHNDARGSARNGVDAGGELGALELLGGNFLIVDDRVEQAFDVFRCDAGDGLFLGQTRLHGQVGPLLGQIALLHEILRLGGAEQRLGGLIDRDLECGGRRALAGAALQHVELLILDGEFEVLHFVVVALKDGADGTELVVSLGHVLMQTGQLQRRADAGDHVLALGVNQVVAIELVGAGVGIAGEADARARLVALVAEDHLHDVDGRTLEVGDLFNAAIGDGLVGFPTVEDGHDRAPELGHGILRELLALLRLVERLELGAQFLEALGGDFRVRLDPKLVLQFVQHLFHRLLREPHGGAGIHLDEPTISVVGETGIAGLLGQTLDGNVVEPEVQDRLEHARHGAGSPGADGNQQGVVGIAKLLARGLLELGHGFLDFLVQTGRQLATELVVFFAGLDRNGESAGHRQADGGHLHETDALAAEDVLGEVLTGRFGLAAAEEEDSLGTLAALGGSFGLGHKRSPWIAILPRRKGLGRLLCGS